MFDNSSQLRRNEYEILYRGDKNMILWAGSSVV